MRPDSRGACSSRPAPSASTCRGAHVSVTTLTNPLGSLGNQLSELPKPSPSAAFLSQPRGAERDRAVLTCQQIDGSNLAITGYTRLLIIKCHGDQPSRGTRSVLGIQGNDAGMVLHGGRAPRLMGPGLGPFHVGCFQMLPRTHTRTILLSALVHGTPSSSPGMQGLF